jgi:hypothetical protein
MLEYFVVIWYILWPFGIFYAHLVYFMAIWYILWPFGIFFPFWYVVPRKIWQACNSCSLVSKKTVEGTICDGKCFLRKHQRRQNWDKLIQFA